MLGSVKVYNDTNDSKDFIQRMTKNTNEFEDDNELLNKVECIDDQLPTMGGKDELITGQNKLFQQLDTLIYGEHFGGLDFKATRKKSVHYYVSDSACQLAILTQNVSFVEYLVSDNYQLLMKMKAEKPDYFELLRKNIALMHPSLVEVWKEEDDRSFTRQQSLRSELSIVNQRSGLVPELYSPTRGKLLASTES